MQRTDFTAMSRLSADIDLLAEGKATGFVRVPHSVHRSAYGWIPIPIVRIKNGDGPNVLMQAGNHGDEWEGQIGLGNLIRSLQPKDISDILCVGGSTRIPTVRPRLADNFRREPNIKINPDEVVAQGAAIQAGSLSGAII